MKINSRMSRPVLRALGVVLFAGGLSLSGAAFAQKAFPSAEAAVDAFVDSVARNDDVQLGEVLGADWRKLIPMGPQADESKTLFLEAWSRNHRVIAAGEGKAALEVGTNGWTLPIPIVRSASGWSFDTRAGAEEVRARRIGRNELAAIQVALAYTDAQEEYARRDWDGDGAKSFALRPLSTRGKRDGLYWPTLADEPESPLGAEFADARPGQPYHGYAYRILTAQGKDAPGGAKSYVRNGRMTDGYALVAWPAKYADTGVMTFIVSRDRVVYEKNLGPGTDALARAIREYNPDATWRKVAPK
jgi:hypothetical protein